MSLQLCKKESYTREWRILSATQICFETLNTSTFEMGDCGHNQEIDRPGQSAVSRLLNNKEFIINGGNRLCDAISLRFGL